jgi:soluble lytic murein transglycosylase
LTRQRRSALVAALACASLLAVTHCAAAKSAATQGGTNNSSGATTKVAAKVAKPGAKKAASAKSKEKKSASGKTTAAAVPPSRARSAPSGASAPAKAAASGPRGAGTGLLQPPAVPRAQAPTPQISDPEIALVKSAIDSLRSGGADKATRIEATISDPVARKLVEWIILRSDRNGAGSARYAAFIAANPRWPSLAMFRRRAEAMLWVENPKPTQVLSFFNGSPPQSAKGHLDARCLPKARLQVQGHRCARLGATIQCLPILRSNCLRSIPSS